MLFIYHNFLKNCKVMVVNKCVISYNLCYRRIHNTVLYFKVNKPINKLFVYILLKKWVYYLLGYLTLLFTTL